MGISSSLAAREEAMKLVIRAAALIKSQFI
jgi:hypothetical protein